MKTCRKCLQELPLSEFAKHRRDGTQNTCKACRREYNKDHYAANRQMYIDKAQARKAGVVQINRTIVLEAFTSGCVDCSCADVRVLQFDHLGDKEFEIGSALPHMGPDRLRKEIAKCEVVCANCHIIRTITRAGSWRSLLTKPL